MMYCYEAHLGLVPVVPEDLPAAGPRRVGWECTYCRAAGKLKESNMTSNGPTARTRYSTPETLNQLLACTARAIDEYQIFA